MKVIKTKYYEETNEMFPLDPQPVRSVDGIWDYQRAGTDEKGDFVIIDFLSEDPVYFEYNAEGTKEKNQLEITTEEEWNKPVTLDIESMDTALQKHVEPVVAPISQKQLTTSSETNQATWLQEIVKFPATIGQLCLNALAAIGLNFRK